MSFILYGQKTDERRHKFSAVLLCLYNFLKITAIPAVLDKVVKLTHD